LNYGIIVVVMGYKGLIIKDEDLNGDINDEESLEKAINEEIELITL